MCHVLVGGLDPPPPYKTFYHRKTDFSLSEIKYLAKFCQPVRSSWVKQAGETYPKNYFKKRKISFSVVKSLVGGGVRTPAPTRIWQISAVAIFAVYRIRCSLSSTLSLNVFGESLKNPI